MGEHGNWINMAYLFLVVGVVLWFAITHQKNLNYFEKDKQVYELKIEELTRQNTLIREENAKLREQLEFHNNVNFNLLNSLVDEYSKLKDDNIALKKQNEKSKQDLTKATSNEKHIIMKIE